jgi:hypothetical protein
VEASRAGAALVSIEEKLDLVLNVLRKLEYSKGQSFHYPQVHSGYTNLVYMTCPVCFGIHPQQTLAFRPNGMNKFIPHPGLGHAEGCLMETLVAEAM